MKICFLGDGNSIHIRRWIQFYKDQGNEVYLITFSDAKIEGVFVYNIGGNNINSNGGNIQYIAYLSEIRKLIKKIKPQIVNAHYVTSYGFISALIGFAPLVISAWGSDILVAPKKNLLYKLITKYSLNKASLVTSDSNYMTTEIKKLTSSKSLTVPMGIEKELLDMYRTESDSELKILSLRTINKNSNIDIIVKAFSIIAKKMQNVKLVIANDGSEMSFIKSLISENNLQDRVEIKGFVSRDEIISLLLSCNIYISIPTSDSTSVTLLEAMACGATCIVSNIPANNEWIKNNESGIVLDKLNEIPLAKSIEYIFENKMSNDVLNMNRKIISERAIWDDNMKTVEDEFIKLINANKRK